MNFDKCSVCACDIKGVSYWLGGKPFCASCYAGEGDPPFEVYDEINRPRHYCSAGIEPIEVIESWGLGFHLGNVIKYVARAGLKGSYVKDLKKARFYLDRAIERQDDDNL